MCEYGRFKKTKKLKSGIGITWDCANHHLVVCFMELNNFAMPFIMSKYDNAYKLCKRPTFEWGASLKPFGVFGCNVCIYASKPMWHVF